MTRVTRKALLLLILMVPGLGAQPDPVEEEEPGPSSAPASRWERRPRERRRPESGDPARPRIDDGEAAAGQAASDSPAGDEPAAGPGSRGTSSNRGPRRPLEPSRPRSPTIGPEPDPAPPVEDGAAPATPDEGASDASPTTGETDTPAPDSGPDAAAAAEPGPADLRDLQNVVSSPPALSGATRAERIRSLMPWVLFLRREIHRRPELGFHEARTARIVADALEAMGYQVRRGVGGTGVVATMRGARAGRTVAYRADMDALPIREETGLPFASQVRRAEGETTPRGEESKPGVMHACGHDVHTAVLIGAARILADEVRSGEGNVIFVAQPAEELGRGAQAMLSDGVFEALRPDSVLALHVFPPLATGRVGWVEGPATANSDNLRIVIRGDGGHGAFPHHSVDPVVIGAQVVVALQVLVAREIDAQEAAVITVGSFHAGTRGNIIPDSAELKVTVRTLTDAVRDQILKKIERTVRGLCEAAGAPDPVISRGENPTRSGVNESSLARRCREVLETVLGAEDVIEVPPAMGGEDFYRFSSIAPTFMFQLGVTAPATLRERGPGGVPAIHSSTFVADEDAIAVGIEAVTALLDAERGAAPAGPASVPRTTADPATLQPSADPAPGLPLDDRGPSIRDRPGLQEPFEP